jgi:(1->4)-alpha-D-glucan 1-alpha-D-glucosylmutase
MRLQQLTGPVMAKGAEDTAFYRYNRFCMLNEVGSDPGVFGTGVEELHEEFRYRAEHAPHAMLAGSTHDTKRSEDVRMRLAALSEIPAEWEQFVQTMSIHNEEYRNDGFPDRNMEYLIYQTVVGAWPIDLDRMRTYVEKAAREAKAYTAWTAQEPEYEGALFGFLKGIMGDEEFLRGVKELVARIAPAGYTNSLASTTLRLTAPGVPDIYGGSELWNLSLVDPDNRRPVDFELRERLLAELDGLSPEDIMGRMEEGLPKLWIVRSLLSLRAKHPECFRAGAAYEALPVAGGAAAHAMSFLRGGRVAVMVPRLPLTLDGRWEDTRVELPAGRWRSPFDETSTDGGAVRLSDLLSTVPVGVLVREGDTADE